MNNKITNTDNWQMISDGTILLHYWNNEKKLCNTINHNISQVAPQPKSELEYCTACCVIMLDLK
jgi:hypothetical protein